MFSANMLCEVRFFLSMQVNLQKSLWLRTRSLVPSIRHELYRYSSEPGSVSVDVHLMAAIKIKLHL